MPKIILEPNTVAKSGDVNHNFQNTWNGNYMDDNSIVLRHLAPDARGATGSILAFAGSTAPVGYVLCDGRALNRNFYSRLWNIIGSQYGSGDGQTTFNVPNLIGRFLVGASATEGEFSSLGRTGGEKYATLGVHHLPAHSHGVNDPGHRHSVDGPIGYGAGPTNTARGRADANSPAQMWGMALGAALTGVTIQNTGGGQGHNNLPPYMACNWIIKT